MRLGSFRSGLGVSGLTSLLIKVVQKVFGLCNMCVCIWYISKTILCWFYQCEIQVPARICGLGSPELFHRWKYFHLQIAFPLLARAQTVPQCSWPLGTACGEGGLFGCIGRVQAIKPSIGTLWWIQAHLYLPIDPHCSSHKVMLFILSSCEAQEMGVLL